MELVNLLIISRPINEINEINEIIITEMIQLYYSNYLMDSVNFLMLSRL